VNESDNIFYASDVCTYSFTNMRQSLNIDSSISYLIFEASG